MKTLRNGIHVLRMLSEIDAPIGVTSLARRLKLDKASVHRLLTTLVDVGFVERDPNLRKYSLGLGLVELATARMRRANITDTALTFMEELRDRLNETVALAVPDGRALTCASVCESRRTVRIAFYVGERLPLQRTATGIVWLASLPAEEQATYLDPQAATDKWDVKQLTAAIEKATATGFAVSHGTHLAGLSGVAAPIFGEGKRAVGVLMVAAETSRLDQVRANEIGRILKDTADCIGRELIGGRPPAVRHT